MNFDLKSNNYLLSLVAGIIGSLVYLVVDKISAKEDDKNNKIDYINYIKIFVIITIIVLGILSYLKSGKNSSGSEINASGIPGDAVSNGLEEVNINQSIHTGNPQF
tara:strand:+ start:114 stop:431 length:318 start_codon:yes stop_codon:yes gene_type:complete